MQFQFHNGSIKRQIVKISLDKKAYSFNSIMVRLKASNPLLGCCIVRMFQFHNGSIKRDPAFIIKTSYVKFQFHNGSIKSDFGGYTDP